MARVTTRAPQMVVLLWWSKRLQTNCTVHLSSNNER